VISSGGSRDWQVRGSGIEAVDPLMGRAVVVDEKKKMEAQRER